MSAPLPHGGAVPPCAPASDISGSQSGALNPVRGGKSALVVSPPSASAPPSAASAVTGAAGLSPEQQAHKLTLISRQTADELRGWYRAIFQDRHRAPFAGELDAIKRRADQLGLSFKG